MSGLSILRHLRLLRLEPGDVLVYRAPRPVPPAAMTATVELLRQAFPETRVVVLEAESTLGAVRSSQGATS